VVIGLVAVGNGSDIDDVNANNELIFPLDGRRW